MKKRVVSLMLVLMMLASMVFVTANAAEGQIKNIIYLIPDGGGYAPYDFANMVKIAGGFNEELFPNKTPTDESPMAMRAQLVGSMTTAPITGGVTDSAAAGTAMATGYKTINGFVGTDRDGVPKANLVEAAESIGMATGIISTYHWAHATPAAFTAHASDRNDLYNIYQQIENKELEVVLGVGYGQVSQYATIQNAIDAGYTVVETKEDLSKVKPGDKIWGNVDPSGIPYDIFTEEGEPTLAEMTQGAITALSGDSDGFFLMVEGGKVDTGGHSSSANTTTSEYLAFDAAFKVALDFAKSRTDTVVICAPDHDTGGMLIPEDPEILAAAVAAVMEGENPETIGWTTASHTDQNVGVWAYVPEGVSLIEGLNPVPGDTESTREDYIIDNTDIAPWCAAFMGVDLDALSEELFCDVSTIGKYNSITRTFTFNNGDKYVVSNQDEYFKDGEKISTNGKVAMYLNNKFYAPAEMIDEEDWNHITEWDPGDGITGTGSASDPYILDNAFDFMEFTANIIAGNTYSGKYIRQTQDIDLTPFTEYQGIGKDYNFAGTYDGYGKKLAVNIISNQDVSVFPVVTGTLMNVGTIGTITSTKDGAFAAGVAYSVGSGGKIVNCFSNAKIKSAYTGGITTYSQGLVANCSFCGTLDSSKNRAVPIGMPKDGSAAEFIECYYLKGVGNYSLETGTAATDTQAKTQLADRLNSNRAGAASKLGYSIGYVSYWTNDYGYPVHHIPIPVVESVTITPDAPSAKRGESITLTATVTGTYNPSKAVTWSIEGKVSEGTTIDENGLLTIAANETATSFNVMAKSNQDGGKVDVITVTVIAPATITVSLTSATGGTVYCDNQPLGDVESFTQGEEITLKAVPEEGSEFKAWINTTTGKIITTDEEYTFTAYTNRKLLALFADEDASDNVFVSFISKNDQYIYYSYLAKGTDVATVAPSPEKMYVSGYYWNGFIPQPGVVNVSTDYRGNYTKNPDVYEVKISGGSDEKGNTEITLGYNSSCTVIANAPDSGKVFTGWLINGRLASLNPEFTFYVFGDMTLEATYGSSLDNAPFVALLDVSEWINGTYNMVSLTGISYLPEGYTFSEAGLLYVKAETDSTTLVIENEGKQVSDKEIKRTSVSENQMFKLSASYAETGLTARGYLVYLDPNGERQVIYTDINYIHEAPDATSTGIEENIDFEY